MALGEIKNQQTSNAPGSTDLLKALEATRERLLDLSLRNNLLNFHDKGAKVVKIVKELPGHIYEFLVIRRQSMTLIPKESELLEDPSPDGQLDLLSRKSEMGNISTGMKAGSDFGNDIDSILQEAIKRVESATSEDLQDKNENDDGASEVTVEEEEDDPDSQPDLYDDCLQTTLEEEQLDGRMRRVLSDYKNILESTGSNLLFLALGFLEWRDPQRDPQKPRLAPLILIPVHLKRELETVPAPGHNGKRRPKMVHVYRYKLSYTGDDTSVNLTLALKLRRDFGLHLPEIGKDGLESPDAYLEEVRRMLNGWQTPTKDPWKVLRSIRIGFFTFSKDVMYRDLDPSIWPKSGLLNLPMVNTILAGRQKNPRREISLSEVESCHQKQVVPTVLDADSSQMKVLIRVASGEDLVVQGPPGTGKSQTISNMIASAIHAGKKVLFMAEKMAALEVVRSRLEKVDLGIYCLELHSKSSSVNAVHDQIKNRLEMKSRSRSRSEFEQHSEQLRKFRAKLNEHCKVMGRKIDALDADIAELFWTTEQCKLRLKDALIRGGGKPEKVELPFFKLAQENGRVEDSQALPTKIELASTRTILQVIAIHWIEDIPTRGVVWSGFHADRLIEEQIAHIGDILQLGISNLQAIAQVQSNSEIPIVAGASIKTLEGVFRGLSAIDSPPQCFDQNVVLDIISNQTNLTKFKEIALDIESVLKNAQTIVGRIAQDMSYSDADLQHSLNSVGLLLRRFDKGGGACDGADKLLADFRDGATRIEAGRAFLEELFKYFPFLPKPANPKEALDFVSWFEKSLQIDSETAQAVATVPFTHNIRRYWNQAQSKLLELEQKKADLQKYFIFEDSPDTQRIGELRRDLREGRDTWREWIPFGRFAKAKRLVRRFSRSKINPTQEEFLDALSRLEKLPGEEQEFRSDSNLCRHLGPLFRGKETPWQIVEAAIEIREDFGKQYINLSITNQLAEALPKLLEGKSELVQQISHIRTALTGVQDLVPKSNNIDAVQHLEKSFESLANQIESNISELSKALSAIRVVKSSNQVPFSELKNVLSVAIEVRKKKNDASLFLYGLKYFKHELLELNTETIQAVLQTLAWLEKASSSTLLRGGFSTWLLETETKQRYGLLFEWLTSLMPLIQNWSATMKKIEQYGTVDSNSMFTALPCDHAAVELIRGLQSALNEIDLLLRWSDYQRSLKALKDAGTFHLLEFSDKYKIGGNDLIIVAEASFHAQWLKFILRNNPELWEFDRITHEVARENFIRLDKTLPDLFQQEVAAQVHKAEGELPPGISYGSVSNFTDMGLIRRELEKQRRHFPVRELIRRSHSALLEMMPCWMMGPGSVAQFLPPEIIEFDLLIMDEASQIRSEDALGSLARAKQVVVVGDSNQMPPSDMFTTNLDENDDDDEAAVADMKSVLDYLTQYLEQSYLNWHYRSQHHALIQFSNSRYYDGKLIVPPSAYRNRSDLGVKWHPISTPSYSNGLNPTEADAQIRHLSEHVFSNARLPVKDQESIGLVVMNVKQKMLLEELWDRRLRDDDAMREANESFKPADGIFIKNLENVQGDERDVISIGFTYGPDTNTGILANRFGPINKDGGWRRLNVLFTRARKRVHVFSSMRASDIIPTSKEGRRGAGDLKAYLEFAESGKIPDYGKRTGKGPDSPFEESVATIVSSLGYEAHFQVGVDGFLIDIGVSHPRHPDLYICGIECDGAPYHSHPVSRDRDRLREEILKSRGWHIYRIWSTDWYRNRKTEIERLSKILEQRVAMSLV